MIQALQIALKISCQYFAIDILPYVDNCVCEPSKLNGFPFNICFESKAFNCNSLGLLEFVVVVYKAWLWNLYFYSRQLWLPTSICRWWWWWWWQRKEKEDRGQSFGHFSTCGQSFPLVGSLENDLLQRMFLWKWSFAENDVLLRMIFWEWSFETDLLQVSEPRADIQRGRKAVEHERVSQEERTRGHQVLNYG